MLIAFEQFQYNINCSYMVTHHVKSHTTSQYLISGHIPYLKNSNISDLNFSYAITQHLFPY